MPGVEVIKKNFAEYLPIVSSQIDKATFISIDLEFTGLTLNRHSKSSLFDTAEERYNKARRNVKEFTVAQFGITAFQSVGTDRYDANTYNFYIFPEAVADQDCRFRMQASSLRFLCQHHFDFNKMIYDGVPFLNQTQERSVRKFWRANIGSSLELDTTHRDSLRHSCSKIARWLVQARDGDILTLEKAEDDIPNEILHEKLMHRMENIWPLPSNDEVLVIEKVSTERRQELIGNRCVGTGDQEKLIESNVGFSNIVKHLIKSQKIIVGHNLYLDLMLIYDKFIDFLPTSYQAYKDGLHGYFPNVYDTKHMSAQLRKKFLGTLHEYDSTSLSGLYTTMMAPEKKACLLFVPAVNIVKTADCKTESDEGEGQVHEAGFDSYMCGYVFLRLAHLQTISKLDPAMVSHPVAFYDYGIHIAPFKNRVNLIRALLHHICLDGPDPRSIRPDQLYITTRGYSAELNPDEVSLLLSSYGAVDINMIGGNKAVVAVNNFTCARRILEAFQSHEKFKVVKYSPLRHSPLVKRLLWTGAVLTAAGICSVALIGNVKRRLFPGKV